jgi:two-component system, OmpR family, sensor histidine kinase BaeS
MKRLIRRSPGRLGLQLALAFMFVAVGAVIASSVISAATVYSNARHILARQETSETRAAAVGAAATYPGGVSVSTLRTSWARALVPVIAVASRSGVSIQVKDAAGNVVRSSPGYISFPPGTARMAPVLVGRLRVGSVTLKFNDSGIAAIVRRYDGQSWAARLGSLGFGALFALVVAMFVAPLIATPVDRLIRTLRARDSGEYDVRVGRIRSFRDMHELVTSFDELADHLDQQEQLRRDFIADISHELRTPIAALRASTEAMLDNAAEPTTGQIASLNDEAARLGTIVDDLQRLASAEAAAVQLRFGLCDIAAVAASAADSLVTIFDQAGVRLERRLSDVHARCDWPRMREVVTNLLTNAVKFTPSGGRVLLETASSGGMAILRVTDSGVGIPPDELPHVSARFYRGGGAAQTSGSGIGLAVVAELVRGHHGRLDIASEPGRGTQVTVEIPLALREA